MDEITIDRPRPNLKLVSDSTRVTKENFWLRGRLAIAAADGSAVRIDRGSPEFEAWATYFVKHLGWEPWALKAVRMGTIEAMTMPAQWPEWFDTSFKSG